MAALASDDDQKYAQNYRQQRPSEAVETQMPVGFLTQFLLRTLSFGFALAAAVSTVTNKQTTEVLPGFFFVARYSYSSALRFFVVANSVAAAFSLVSLLHLIVVGRRGSNVSPPRFFLLFLLDLMMMGLVVAGCSAATAIGMVGKYGENHSGWMPICDHFQRFCNRGTTSLALSYLSLVCLLVLTIMSALNSSRSS